MNQQDASQLLRPNRYKKQNIYSRDSLGRFSRDVFQFGNLPTEIQEMILLKAAVTSHLSSKKLGATYKMLASVSQAWKEMTSRPTFQQRVKRQAYRKG